MTGTNSARSRSPRAKEKLGIDFPPGRVFIIGDTPHDVACGKAIGAKTIAVATGGFSVAQLEACSPHAHVCRFVGYASALENYSLVSAVSF